MFGNNAQVNRTETAVAASEKLRDETKQFMLSVENIFEKYSCERQYFRKNGEWTIAAIRSSDLDYRDFWRHLEIKFDGKPVALLDFRLIDDNLVGTLAIDNWNGLSVDDCDWLLFAMATMLVKPGLRLYESARRALRTTLNETMWNKFSGAASSVCPRSSISVPMTDLAPLSESDWYNLDDLTRNLERAHEVRP